MSIYIRLYKIPGVVSHRARKQSGGYQGGGGNGALLLRECSFSFARWRVLEMDGDDGCLTVWIDWMP